jgi:uracil-DNA glycosylase
MEHYLNPLYQDLVFMSQTAPKIEESWLRLLEAEFSKPYFEALVHFLKEEIAKEVVYPKGGLIFNAFNSLKVENVKAVILGQDPYHGPGQANGLSFSVNPGVAIPPSLRNIFIELKDDLGVEAPRSGDLSKWSGQGVLLLNAILTVRHKQPASHKDSGWAQFTDAVIKRLSETQEHIVFILWGAFAQSKSVLIDDSKHTLIMSPHPSPFSAHRGFLGSKPFSKANAALQAQNQKPIDWQL